MIRKLIQNSQHLSIQKQIIYQHLHIPNHNNMKSVLILGIIALIMGQVLAEPTILTYFTQHEIEQQSDYIEIGIKVKSEDHNLRQAVNQAKQIVQKLERIVLDHCNTHAKKKSECDDVFEASKNQISPKYQLVRKVQTFMGLAFIVRHQITIKVKNVQGLGKMSDQLLKAGANLVQIDSFEWKSEDQTNPERQALSAGVEDGKQICQRMGLKMSRIVSATEVEEKQEPEEEDQEEGEEGGEQEEEEEEEAQVIIFKFEVECS